jgi:hypothetical protein
MRFIWALSRRKQAGAAIRAGKNRSIAADGVPAPPLFAAARYITALTGDAA